MQKQVTLLGSGAYGKTYLFTTSDDQYVIKEIKTTQMTDIEIQYQEREFKILKSLDHLNVVKIFEYRKYSEIIHIKLSYAEFGDLEHFIRHRNLDTNECLDIIYQIAFGLHYLHSKKVIHRDLKASNILVTQVNNKHIFQICDFGLSKQFIKTHDLATSLVGTPAYIAPEVCLQRPYDSKVDTWSLGILAYYLFARKLPFEGSSLKELQINIVKAPLSDAQNMLSDDIMNLIRMMLKKDPTSRININQILLHPVFSLAAKKYHLFLLQNCFELELAQYNNIYSLKTPQLFNCADQLKQDQLLFKLKCDFVDTCKYSAFYDSVKLISQGQSLVLFEQAFSQRQKYFIEKYYKHIKENL